MVALPPILLYSASVVVSAAAASAPVGPGRIPLLAALTVALHLLYGAGIAAGLLFPRFRSRSPREGEVVLRRIKGFGDTFPGDVQQSSPESAD
jgi:hypothetical protein